MAILEGLMGRKRHRWGALHQRAVIDYELGVRTGDEERVEQARLGFMRVRDELGRDPRTADHRSGLASLRLGQLLAGQGACKSALNCLLEAHAIFSARGSWRYLEATRVELELLFECRAD